MSRNYFAVRRQRTLLHCNNGCRIVCAVVRVPPEMENGEIDDITAACQTYDRMCYGASEAESGTCKICEIWRKKETKLVNEIKEAERRTNMAGAHFNNFIMSYIGRWVCCILTVFSCTIACTWSRMSTICYDSKNWKLLRCEEREYFVVTHLVTHRRRFFFFEMKYWIRFRQPVKIDQQTGSRVSTGFAIVRISASEHKIYWKRKKKVFSPFLYLFLHFVDCDCEGLVPSLLRVWFTFFIHINRHNFTISFSATFLFNVCTTHTHSRFPFGLTPAAFLR